MLTPANFWNRTHFFPLFFYIFKLKKQQQPTRTLLKQKREWRKLKLVASLAIPIEKVDLELDFCGECNELDILLLITSELTQSFLIGRTTGFAATDFQPPPPPTNSSLTTHCWSRVTGAWTVWSRAPPPAPSVSTTVTMPTVWQPWATPPCFQATDFTWEEGGGRSGGSRPSSLMGPAAVAEALTDLSRYEINLVMCFLLCI